MTIHAVDFKTKRHRERAKELIDGVCEAIDNIEYQVAGYGLVVWDDAGRCALSYMEGGPIPKGLIGSYCGDKLDILAHKTMQIKSQ